MKKKTLFKFMIETFGKDAVLETAKRLNAQPRSTLTPEQIQFLTELQMYLIETSTVTERRQAYADAKKDMVKAVLKRSA